MPDSNKADFEANAVLAAQDFSIRQNESQAAMQANETFVLDAAAGRVLGDTGETLGFAKKTATYDRSVAQARQDAHHQALADLDLMLNDPAKTHVRAWRTQRDMLQALPESLQRAKDRLDADTKGLARLQADPNASPEKLESFAKKVREGSAEIARLEQLTNDAPQIRATLTAQLAADEDIQALVQQEQKCETLNAVSSSYNRVAAASSQLYDNDSRMKSPSMGGDRQLISRSVASSEVDRLIGTGVIAQEKFALDDQNKLMGVSIQCDGAGVRSQPGTTDEWGRPQTAFLDIDYSAPAVQRGLCDLEAMDYITGQIDRHPGNIFVDPQTGKVTGIDNDLAFPELDREDMLDRNGGELKSKAVAGMPRVMHTETAAKLMAVSPEELRTTLRNIQPPDGSQGLGDREIEGAVARLENLQAAIRDPESVPGGFQLVDQFDKTTFEEAVAVHEAQKASESKYEARHATSYLSSVLAEEADIKQKIADGDTGCVLRDASSVRPARRDEQYAEYARQAEIAKQTFRANPQMIPDPADRRQVVDLKQQIAETKAKIAEYDARLAKLENPSLGGRLAAVRHGGVDGARNVTAAKKEDAQRRLDSLERKLDKAMEKSIPVDLKDGLYQDAGVAVAQRQQPVQPQTVPLGPAVAGSPPIATRVPLQDLPPPVAPRVPHANVDQAGAGVAPLAVQNLENEIRNTEAALANIELQINNPSSRSSSSNQPPDTDNLPELQQRQAEKQQQLKMLRTQLAQQTVVPTPDDTPSSIPVPSPGPLSTPAQDGDLSPPLPSRAPPPVPVDEGPDLSANSDLRFPPPPSYPPPPPPDVLNHAASTPSVDAPVVAAGAPSQLAVTLSPQQIDAMIARDDFKPAAWTPDSPIGAANPSRYHKGDSYTNSFDTTTGDQLNPANSAAVELRMIELQELEPRWQHIQQLEGQLESLQQKFGASSNRPEIKAIKAELEDLYEDVDVFEARVAALKEARQVGSKQSRLAAINQQWAAEADVPDKTSKVQFKPDRVQQTPGLQATAPDPLAQPAKSAMKQTATVETNQDTLQNAQQRQDRIDRLTTPAPTLLSSVRDNLSPAALQAKAAALQVKAAELNAEGRLRDVDQGIQDKYKDLKTKLKDPTLTEDQKVKIQTEMAKLKQDHPALEQLDRSTIGRNLHSGLRDAVQTASYIKDRVTHPMDTLNDVRSQIRDGAKSLKQGLKDSLPDRLKIATINHDLSKLDDKISDLKGQLKQLHKERSDYQACQTDSLIKSRRDDHLGEEAREEVMARLEQHYGDVSGKSPQEIAEMDMELTNQGLAEFDEKIAALEGSIAKAEAKAGVLKGQKDAIKNKKDVSQSQGQDQDQNRVVQRKV